MIAIDPPTPSSRSVADALAIASQLNARFGELGWPVLASVETTDGGDERLVVTRTRSAGGSAIPAASLRVAAASLERTNLVESVLLELQSCGWNRAGEPSAPRGDVVWCAPA